MNQPTNICPLRAIASIGTGSGSAVCIKERCAWWGDYRCAVVTLADSLSSLDMNGLTVSVIS